MRSKSICSVIPKALCLASSLAALGTGLSAGASLQLNFITTNALNANVAGSYQTLSPAHAANTLLEQDTRWNNFSAPTESSSLFYSDNTGATPEVGVSIIFGRETTSGNNTIGFGTTADINNTALTGSGGTNSGQVILTSSANSIYGSGTTVGNTAPGRAGWLAGTTGTPLALGMKIDGLAAGTYTVYLMGRNTNSNAIDPGTGARAMNFYVSTGAVSATTFNFTGIAAATQQNSNFATVTDPSNLTIYDQFVNGQNYVEITVSVQNGQSLFIASDGATAGEARGILNMVQIVSVPEPSAAGLTLLALAGVIRRRRR